MITVLKEFDSFCRKAIELYRIDVSHFTNPTFKEEIIETQILDILKVINTRIEGYNTYDANVIAELKRIAHQHLNNYKSELENG